MRKTRLPVLVALLILTTAITAQQAPSADVAFKAAMHREVVEGNLPAAIDEYKAIIARFPNDRIVGAKALVQLGGCYEKLGQADARKTYEQVIRDYADQGDAAAQARARLTALAGTSDAPSGSTMTVRRVWDGRKANYLGGVSPDGRYLSFDDQDTGDLAIHDLATGLDRRLTNNTSARSNGAVGSSVPSPDGKSIAYSWYDWNRSVELRIIGLDGSTPRTLRTAGADVDEEPVAWSPDGTQLLIESGKPDGTTDMMLVTVADGSAKLLKAPGADDRVRGGEFSRDGRYIAWTVKDGLSLVEVQTGREYLLVPDLSPHGVMGWTPDGRHILFHSERSGSPDVWRVAAADGKAVGEPELVKKGYYGNRALGFTREGAFYYGVRTPTRDVYVAELGTSGGKLAVPPQPVSRRWSGVSGNPDWSPDGRFLAYLRNQTQDSSFPSFIVIRSTSTGEERELRVVGMTSLGLALRWTPDGKAVVVSAFEPGKGRSLVRVDVQTGQATPVTPRSLGPFPRFDLSPDGKTIFYIYAPEGSGSQPPQLLARDLQSGRETEILRKPGLIYVSVSPDGQRVVVGAQENRAIVLRVMPATGGPLRELITNRVEGTSYRVCSWTPDGRYVIFATNPKGSAPIENVQMWRVAAEGGEPQRLDVGVDSPYYLRVHPDGRHVAVGTWSVATEIYVMEHFLPKAAAPTARAK
jgi:Tol biopolymer transport system component